MGQGVNVAVDRFVTVGEAIADDNPEIKVDMYEACKEARAAGKGLFLSSTFLIYFYFLIIESIELLFVYTSL